jgi:hypothetical protein
MSFIWRILGKDGVKNLRARMIEDLEAGRALPHMTPEIDPAAIRASIRSALAQEAIN